MSYLSYGNTQTHAGNHQNVGWGNRFPRPTLNDFLTQTVRTPQAQLGWGKIANFKTTVTVTQLLPRFKQCDPTAESAVTGLIPGTDLRPADILTQALGNTVTALDVGITSPDSIRAGTDCAASMFQRKMEYYRPYFGVLEQQNIEYIPLTWSSYGRPHSSTVTVLRTLSKRISRRRGTTTAAAVYHSMQSAIATEIWRRAAKQVFWCWPGGERDSDDAG